MTKEQIEAEIADLEKREQQIAAFTTHATLAGRRVAAAHEQDARQTAARLAWLRERLAEKG